MTILITIVALTIIISASCSLFESVLYSARLSTLEAARKKGYGGRRGIQMIALKKNISQPLAAILILNTVANTAGATVAGAYANTVLSPWMVPIFSGVLTLLILFFSEIMPKTIGAVHWRQLWSAIVIPLNSMNIALKPLIFIAEKFTNLFTSSNPTAAITEDEILAMVRLGTRSGYRKLPQASDGFSEAPKAYCHRQR